MAFSEFEMKRLEKVVGAFIDRKRPPAHLRDRVDLIFRIKGQSVEILEVRPTWRGTPGEITEHPLAKATYVRNSDLWKVFWMRADLKWHAYPPEPQVGTVERFLALVSEDKHALFFG